VIRPMTDVFETADQPVIEAIGKTLEGSQILRPAKSGDPRVQVASLASQSSKRFGSRLPSMAA
jgi:hypothetical protein